MLDVPRDHLASAADGRFVYAVGGRLLASSQTSAAFERYDPASDTWEPLPDLPTPRGGLLATMAGRRVVAAGGESASEAWRRALGRGRSPDPALIGCFQASTPIPKSRAQAYDGPN